MEIVPVFKEAHVPGFYTTGAQTELQRAAFQHDDGVLSTFSPNWAIQIITKALLFNANVTELAVLKTLTLHGPWPPRSWPIQPLSVRDM